MFASNSEMFWSYKGWGLLGSYPTENACRDVQSSCDSIYEKVKKYFKNYHALEGLGNHIKNLSKNRSLMFKQTVSTIDEGLTHIRARIYRGWFWQSLPKYIQEMNAKLFKIESSLEAVRKIIFPVAFLLKNKLFMEEKLAHTISKIFEVQEGKMKGWEFLHSSDLGSKMLKALTIDNISPDFGSNEILGDIPAMNYMIRRQELGTGGHLSEEFLAAEEIAIAIHDYDKGFDLGMCKYI